jgi:hypothetical protein
VTMLAIQSRRKCSLRRGRVSANSPSNLTGAG